MRAGVSDLVVMSASVVSVISRFLEEYLSTTPQRLKLLDAYLLYILLTGALQFGYCLLVGTFPFNSFLSGFISCVGSFILAGNDSISNRSNVILVRCFYSHRPPPRKVVRGACMALFFVNDGEIEAQKGCHIPNTPKPPSSWG